MGGPKPPCTTCYSYEAGDRWFARPRQGLWFAKTGFHKNGNKSHGLFNLAIGSEPIGTIFGDLSFWGARGTLPGFFVRLCGYRESGLRETIVFYRVNVDS
jgi:hypothetical protein